jgi:ubiquinol-cytochrome c reductase cytochrome b subunit
MLGTIVNLNHPTDTVHWHFFQMSVANVIVLGVTLLLFVLVRALPLERMPLRGRPLPWTHACALAALASLVLLLVSGVILGLNSAAWWQDTGLGRFVNSIHLWAVELFFAFMVINLGGQLFTVAWRAGGTRLWVTGALAFLLAVPAALTGYLSQQNFDAQWIASQARGSLNAIGAGAWFNVTNFAQMYRYHTLVLPFALALLVAGHVVLVRRHPAALPAPEPKTGASGSAGTPVSRPAASAHP